MNFGTRARAEDPNISMRLIEKIKHKCQDYYRNPSSPSASYISDLQLDILQFKKDCLVAIELAHQYIEKSLSTTPAPSSRSDLLKLEYELEKFKTENKLLQDQIESLKSQKIETVNLDELTSNSEPDQGQDKLISELQGQLVIQEMKFENILSDLENENKELKNIKERLETEVKEIMRKNEILEKKVKESLNGYSKLIARKSTGNKEVQTGRVEMRLEVGAGIEIQRSNDAMSQISKLSITESEIFDMTSMQVCDIHRQTDTGIEKTMQSLCLVNYPCIAKNSNLQISQKSSLQIFPIYNPPSPADAIPPNLSLSSFTMQISPIYKPPSPPYTIPPILSSSSISMQILPIYKPASPSDTKSPIILSSSSFTMEILPIYKPPSPADTKLPILLSSSSFSISILPRPIFTQKLSINKIFSFFKKPQISKEGDFNYTQQLPKPTFFQQKNFSSVKILNIDKISALTLDKIVIEESKSKISRRRSTLNTATDRKPAIEEYFSLTFQAVRMKCGKIEKSQTPEELYQKAVNDNIPFFEWHEWVLSQLKS